MKIFVLGEGVEKEDKELIEKYPSQFQIVGYTEELRQGLEGCIKNNEECALFAHYAKWRRYIDHTFMSAIDMGIDPVIIIQGIEENALLAVKEHCEAQGWECLSRDDFVKKYLTGDK